MMDKQISENKIDAEQQVRLYLRILKYQQKYIEAFEFLEGDLCKRIYPGAPIALKIELLKSLERWSECNVLLKGLLRQKCVRFLLSALLVSDWFSFYSCDRWDYHKDYILSVGKLQQSATTVDGADCTFKQCNQFLCQVYSFGDQYFNDHGRNTKFWIFQLIDSGGKVERGPYLGRLELHHTMTELNENANELLGDLLELLVEYFRKVNFFVFIL